MSGSAPTVVRLWASNAASTTDYNSGFAVSVGDLCVLWKAGAPGSVGTGLPIYTIGGTDAGFSTAKVDTSNNGTSVKASIFYKVLTSGDISGGNLVGFSANQGGTTTLRIGMAVYRHANLFDSSTTLLLGTSDNVNATAPRTVATLTDANRAIVAVSVFAISGGTPTTLQYTWAGAPTGNTAARDPYYDESSGGGTIPDSSATTQTHGGHGAGRTDSTGVTINSGSTSHSDTHIVAADLGAALGNDGNFPTSSYISAVNPGTGFTSSANATGSASVVTLTQPHYGTGTSVIQADYQQFDTSDTPGTVTISTGTGNNTHVVVTAEFQAQSSDRAFTLSDNLGLTDNSSHGADYARNPTDNLGLTDNSVGQKNGNAWTALFTDHLGISDVVPRAQTANFTDHLGLTDAGTVNVSQPEKLNLTDNLTPGHGYGRVITDPLGIHDVATTSLSGGNNQQRNLTDNLGLHDTVLELPGNHFTAFITDSFGLVDTIGTSHLFAETFGLRDQVLINVPISRWFRPPTEDTVSDIAFDVPPIWNRLMRYYPLRKRGRAVWKLPDGSYTFNQPYPTIEDTEVNRTSLFPAVPTPPSGLGTSTSTLVAVTYEKVFLGGHIYEITTQDELDGLSTFLTSEGYTPNDWLTTVPPGTQPAQPLPPPAPPTPPDLYYDKQVAGGSYQVFKLASNGVTETQLTFDTTRDNWNPEFNNGKVYYSSVPVGEHDTAVGFTHTTIRRMNADGTGDVLVLGIPGSAGPAATWTSYGGPKLNPAGTRMCLWVTTAAAHAIVELETTNFTGSNIPVVIANPNVAVDPSYSPNGAFIVYVEAVSGIPFISRVNAGSNFSSNGHTVLKAGGVGVGWFDPFYSPDGSKILALAHDANPDPQHPILGQFSTFVMNADGTGAVRATPVGNIVQRSRWYTNEVIYTAYITYPITQTFQLYSFHADGSQFGPVLFNGNNLTGEYPCPVAP